MPCMALRIPDKYPCHCEGGLPPVAISRYCLSISIKVKSMYYVYILTNKNHTVLYTGVTSDLIRRVYEHKNHADPKSFTAKYKTEKLVYFEETADVKAAIEREKQIKSWSRNRKTDLIFEKNPQWVDLYNRLLG